MEESKSININENSWGYFSDFKVKFNGKTVQQVREAIQKELTDEDSQELNVAFLSYKLSTLHIEQIYFQ